jgi:dTDP-4-amino-4,6-dideoxygalactose transaminase
VIDGATSTWAQYTIQVDEGVGRDKVAADLKAKGVPTAIYYTIPMNAQKAYRHYPSAPTPASERLAKRVISLPMHPYLDEATQDRVVDAVLESVGGRA